MQKEGIFSFNERERERGIGFRSSLHPSSEEEGGGGGGGEEQRKKEKKKTTPPQTTTIPLCEERTPVLYRELLTV